MAKTLALPWDLIATIPTFSTDQFGDVLPLSAGSTVTSDNAAVVIQLAADGTSCQLVASARTGSANITLSPAAGSSVAPDTVAVSIVAPAATANVFDVGNVTFASNPSPPAS